MILFFHLWFLHQNIFFLLEFIPLFFTFELIVYKQAIHWFPDSLQMIHKHY